jgi:hypothetical protein
MNFKEKKGILRCEIFGDIGKPSKYKLQRYIDLIWLFLHHKEKLLKNCTKYEVTTSKIVELVKQDVIKLWTVADLPMVSSNRISKKIEDFYKKYRALSKRKRYENLLDSALQEFEEYVGNTFSICSCQCNCEKVCSCNCGMSEEKCNFWRDQKTDRLMSTHQLKTYLIFLVDELWIIFRRFYQRRS